MAGLPFALAGFAPEASQRRPSCYFLCAVQERRSSKSPPARSFSGYCPTGSLTAVFGLQESMMMAGSSAGSLAAPLLVAAAGPEGAFVVAGLFFLL